MTTRIFNSTVILESINRPGRLSLATLFFGVDKTREPSGRSIIISPCPQVSPPPAHSRPGSRPPTRESSPCPTNGSSNSARTPPPKRWKRSFDMSGAVVSAAAADMRSQQQPQQEPKTEPDAQQPLPMVRRVKQILTTWYMYNFLVQNVQRSNDK